MNWHTVPKIDAHVHLLPPERLVEKKEYDPQVWGHADPEEYAALMEQFRVEKAVLVPINEPFTYYRDPPQTNGWLGKMAERGGGRFLACADVVNQGGYFQESSPLWLERAVKEDGLRGLKLHPSNLGIPMDSLDMVPVLRTAAELEVPVMVHSYPYAAQCYDLCEPAKIHKMARVFPDVTFIISHLGGARWNDALEGGEYVDISGFLPELVRLYGVEQANRILRAFGPERLLFATDYPQVYLCRPEEIYSTYCGILDQMDFTPAEMERIAYGNAADIFKL